MATGIMHSPIHRTMSPDIAVTSYDDGPVTSPTMRSQVQDFTSLAPPQTQRYDTSDGERSDRYYTASSGDENFDDDYDDDDDEDGMCIRLDSDDDTTSLSGLHINLKTLQAVSSMLAHYHPIIQSDPYGNPIFVAPPPPEDEYSEQDGAMASASGRDFLGSTTSHDTTLTGDDDYQCALQELDDVIIGQDQTLLSDALTELTDVMEKMTYFSAEAVDDI
ncbi:uncharacterized protein LOC100186751 [Ciona intestinalis]